jgi:hypothetical protein
MKQQNPNPQVTILLAVLGLLAAGCSAFSPQPPSASADTPSSQQLPFSEVKPQVIPAETVLYVRLKQSLRAATAEAGQDFTAVLDEPLQADHQLVAPPGSQVTGKVVAARESGRLHSAGYVRIRLSSILINGRQFPLVTNSVIAAGGSLRIHSFSFLGAGNSFQDNGDKREAGFTRDQRLNFRLTQPLSISGNN